MKIKCNCLFFLLLFVSTIPGVAQDQIEDFSGTFSGDAPIFTPVSPEATSLGLYGNHKLSGNTGHMTHSVPLYTIQVPGGYSWPLSLNYNYNGLILAGEPSLFGLGSVLSGYGVITREVRGLEDDHPNGYYGINNVKQKIDDYVNNNSITLSDLRMFRSGEFDSELDVYHVSVGDVQFSFKLKENNEPIFLSKHNHKVSYTPESVTVTDDRGINYIFADREQNERYDNDPYYDPVDPHFTTSWQLSEVQYPNGESIHFNYMTHVYLSYGFYAQGGKTKTTEDENGYYKTYANGDYTDGTSQQTIHRKIPSRITFTGGSINLNQVDIDNRKLIGSIDIKYQTDGMGTGQTFLTYDLTYAGNRDVLTTINKNGEFYYGFEYYGSGPPFCDDTNKPLAQDLWGFYNGKPNSYAINIPYSSYEADRSPDFASTREGAMKKIIYPTGGYTEIRYEQNQVKSVYEEESTDKDATFNRQLLVRMQCDDDINAPNVKEIEHHYTFEFPVVAEVQTRLQGTRGGSHFKTSLYRTDGNCPAVHGGIGPYIYSNFEIDAQYLRDVLNEPVPEMCPAWADEFGPDDGDPHDYVDEFHYSGRIIIPAGEYTMHLWTDYNHLSDVYGEIKIKFYRPDVEKNDMTGVYEVNKNVGGIRVSRMISYNQNGTPVSTYYDYNDDKRLSTAKLVAEPITNVEYNIMTTSLAGETYNHRIIEYFWNKYSMKEARPSSPVAYMEIREADYFAIEEDTRAGGFKEREPGSGGVNPDGSNIYSIIGPEHNRNDKDYIKRYPNGYTLRKYVYPLLRSYEHPQVPRGKNLTEGLVDEQITYGYDSENPYTPIKLNESNYGYEDFSDSEVSLDCPYSFRIERKLSMYWNCAAGDCDYYPTNEQPNISNHRTAGYRETYSRQMPKLNVTKVYDYSTGSETVKSQQVNMTYDSRYQLKEQTTTHPDGSILKKKFYYPYDNGFAGTAPYDDIITNNQLTKIVLEQSYKGTDLLGKKKTQYIAVGANDYKPYKIGVAKGTNPVEDRVLIGYDVKGNATEVTQLSAAGGSPSINDSKVEYIWGYHKTRVIAKIENLSGSVPATTISDLQSLSDADIDEQSENDLRAALEDMRNQYPEAMITTYTHDPGIGVTSETDPNGLTTYYKYDDQNRMYLVKNHKNEIIKKYDYHYKNN